MLSPIKLRISEKLRDKRYRHRFFRGRTQDEVAYQLRLFRKKRGNMSQSELARECGMKQSAISRLEQASYSRWGIQTLFRIADALDFRVRVVIDDCEDAIREYERIEAAEEGQHYCESVNTQQGEVEAEEVYTPSLYEGDASPSRDLAFANSGTAYVQ